MLELTEPAPDLARQVYFTYTIFLHPENVDEKRLFYLVGNSTFVLVDRWFPCLFMYRCSVVLGDATLTEYNLTLTWVRLLCSVLLAICTV